MSEMMIIFGNIEKIEVRDFENFKMLIISRGFLLGFWDFSKMKDEFFEIDFRIDLINRF